MGGVVQALHAAGFDCWVPVAPGHVAGQTGFSSLRDFAQLASWLQEHHGPFSAGVGHSLGGGALLMSADHGSKWDKLVTISSFAKTDRVFHEFIRQSGLPLRYVDRLFERVTHELGSDPHLYSPHLAKHTGALLLVHSPDDVEVPFSDAECLHHHFPQSTLVATSPLGHRKILWRSETWEAVVGYLHQ
jgi:pimeloyl-ACP methyl ester carboxylesterase